MTIDFSQIIIPYLRDADIWDKAEKARGLDWNGSIPIDIDLIAEKEHGLDLIPITGLKKIANTDAFLTGDLNEIIYDDSVNDFRTRFSIAHELGHKILHSVEIGILRQKSYEYWKEVIDEMPIDLWSRAEYQANEFAGRILVPKSNLIVEIKELGTKILSAIERIPDLESGAIKGYMAPLLSKKFNVSADVIERRLDKENIDIIKICTP